MPGTNPNPGGGSGLVNMADQFGGLPMDQLIGGPLAACCNAQTQLAKASADFITQVGLEEDPKTKALKTRTVDFSFERPVNDPSGASIEQDRES